MSDGDVVMAETKGCGVGDDSKGDSSELILPRVDETLLAEMVAMGFVELSSRKALMAGSANAEQAVQWVLDHETDADISAPIALVAADSAAARTGAPLVAKAFKCVETGRLFRTSDEVQAYATRTGRSDFEETTEEKKSLTEAEKKEKISELKALAASRRLEREQVEKVGDIEAEKKRREAGSKTAETRESLEKAARMREADRAKREKNTALRERERLRAEIAKDKAERRARGGKLVGKLSVEGYAPSIDQNQDRWISAPCEMVEKLRRVGPEMPRLGDDARVRGLCKRLAGQSEALATLFAETFQGSSVAETFQGAFGRGAPRGPPLEDPEKSARQNGPLGGALERSLWQTFSSRHSLVAVPRGNLPGHSLSGPTTKGPPQRANLCKDGPVDGK
ncbi:hypothetical protein M885DRAFT_342078 [Pelagophyceae sp. CCMP2097]|nr:hypothetical protein M885DRAFT_342078 [Pelagophyceae sp. CCMP2097]